MELPVMPPIDPMLAKPAGDEVPAPDAVEGGLAYEPKWDGFRALIYRDGDEVQIWGRGGKDLTYCFPEVVAAALANLPERAVLDGELVVAHDGRLWFEELTNRIRPRSEAGKWKIAELAEQSPCAYVAFDALAVGEQALLAEPYRTRRAALERALAAAQPPFFVTPVTDDQSLAREWFSHFEGAGLDGLVCKPWQSPYTPGKRTLLKVKHARTTDVVVAGWRAHKEPDADGQRVVGSLLLGLYDERGTLHHVGVASSFSAARRAALLTELAPYAVGDAGLAGHPWASWAEQAAHLGSRLPGGVSRWTGTKDLSWIPLRAELVAEVAYDHMEGDRFRHVAQLVRWRPDRDPQSCTYDQLDRPVRFDLGDVLPGVRR
ncbi:MAG: ATP-dependent DNA ligase [Actinomycetota bacterium]|nr:MAG: ATP-dependent DNA ligase [Actinomycetota bacterium]